MSGEGMPEKRLLRALELELTERGTSVTFDAAERTEASVVIADPDEEYPVDSLIEDGGTVFYCHYDSETPPDGTVSVIRPFSVSRFAETLTKNVTDLTPAAVFEPELVLKNGVLSYGEEIIELSQTEMLLFSVLYENRGTPVSRDILHRTVWGIGDSNVLDVYVSYLRKKLDHRFGKQFIVTVRGKGYMLR